MLFRSDEVDPQASARDGRAAQTQKRIQRESHPIETVQSQAVLRQARREGRRMGAVLVAALDGLVGDEPRVAPAPETVHPASPTADIRRILIPRADGGPIKRRRAIRCEVKDELVAVVEEPVAVDRPRFLTRATRSDPTRRGRVTRRVA